MITSEFHSILKSLDLTDFQVTRIETFLNTNKARINADTVEFPDGSLYYSENYVKLMMDRAKSSGIREGRQEPVKHIAEIRNMECRKCGYKEDF
jgi:purine nucleoside phosphorylase